MLNENQLNSNLLNDAASGAAAVVAPQYSFNGFDFMEAGAVITSTIQRDVPPPRDWNFQPIPRANGAISRSNYWRQRIITFSGTLIADTKIELETKLHEMKLALSQQDGSLVFPDENTNRVAVCSWNNPESSFDRSQHFMITKCNFSIEFITSTKPFLYDAGYSYASWLTQTTNLLEEEVTTSGTAEMDVVAVIIFEDKTNVETVTFENTTTGAKISVPVPGITDTSVLIIDGENKNVTLDGTEIDFDGYFPSYFNGANTIAVGLEGASTPAATYNVTSKHKGAYL